MEQKVKIREVIRETADAITVKFENERLFAGYVSGQFINIVEELKGEAISRSYSFSSSPKTDLYPAITIKQIPGGRLSTHLVNTLRSGAEIHIGEPLGRFALNEVALDKKHLIMIAGGSGITPLFSMIKTAFILSPSVRITLLYGNRNSSSIIFRNELERLQRAFSSRFSVRHFLEDVETHRPGVQPGYITREAIRHSLAMFPEAIAEVYMCGPSAMMSAIDLQLQQLQVPNGRVFRESFGDASAARETAHTGGPARMAEIYVKKGNEAFHFQASTDQFILQEALSKGIRLPHSCKEAMCGACKTKLLSGEVDMTENYALTDSQLKEGYVLLCSTKPRSSRIEFAYT